MFNRWTSELHLSFYKLDVTKWAGNSKITDKCDAEGGSSPTLDESENRKTLDKVVMSIRFVGDFFDRY